VKYGIVSGVIPAHLPYSAPIQEACTERDFSAFLTYAVAWRETIRGEIAGLWVPLTAATVVSGDGGHGLCQLTSSWPNPGWETPETNVCWAIDHYLKPDMDWLAGKGLTGEALIRGTAAAFNAGLGAAWDGHIERNDFDAYTTGNDYAADVLSVYNALVERRTFT
jgi:hypothetical protein